MAAQPPQPVQREFESAAENGLPLRDRYYLFIDILREDCGPDEYYGSRITRLEYQDPYFNVVLRYCGSPVTFKVRKEDIYFILFRPGVGEPNLEDPENNEPWYDIMNTGYPGAHPTGITASYSELGQLSEAIQVGPLAFQMAIAGLAKGKDRKHNIRLVLLHVAEAMRNDEVKLYIGELMDSDPYTGASNLRSRHITLIHGWAHESERIQTAIREGGIDAALVGGFYLTPRVALLSVRLVKIIMPAV